MNLQDQLTTAAFIAMGLQLPFDYSPVQFNAALDHWDGGCLELVQEATRYAPYIVSLIEAGRAVAGAFPGVADYDISEEFGAWFCRAVLAAPEACTLPATFDCERKAIDLTLVFFSEVDGVDPSHLKAALVAVISHIGASSYRTYATRDLQ